MEEVTKLTFICMCRCLRKNEVYFYVYVNIIIQKICTSI